MDIKTNCKLNTVNDRPDCRVTSTSRAAERSTKSKRKPNNRSKHLYKDPRFLPFFNYTHPTRIKQIKLAHRSNETYDMDLSDRPAVNTINTAQNSTDESRRWTGRSHRLPSPTRCTDSLRSNSQWQNQSGPSSAKVKILEDKIVAPNYSKATNPSPQVSDVSHDNQFLKVNRPVLYHDQHERKITIDSSVHSNDNVQQIRPNISTPSMKSSLSSLYRLKCMMDDICRIRNHQQNEQLFKISPELCTQKILHTPTEANPIDRHARSQSATHRASSTQMVTDKSTQVNPIEQSDSSQRATRKVLNTSEGNVHGRVKVIPIIIPERNPSRTRKKLSLPIRQPFKHLKLLCEQKLSAVSEHHSHEKVSLQNVHSEKSIKIDDVHENSHHHKISQNTPSAVQNTSSSSNHSSSPRNGSSGEQIALVTRDRSISAASDQERRTGKPPELNHTEKSVNFKNNAEHESSVQITSNTNQSIKQSYKKKILLSYERYIQEQSSTVSEDFLHQEIPTKEVTVERRTEDNHIDQTTCQENNMEQESNGNINIFSSIDALPKVKLLVEQSFLEVLKVLLEDVQINMGSISLIGNEIDKTFTQLNESMQELHKDMDRYLELVKNNSAESVSQNPPVNPAENFAKNKNKKSNNVERNNIADDDNDVDDTDTDDSDVDHRNKDDDNENHDGYYEPPRKKRFTKRAFVLPPEYDPHNSRWTLKYQASEPGVVELMPHSKIYINELKLANCKRVANNYKTFGRMLLVEIFSQNALSVCSLTGAKANAFNVHKSDIRPGLDKEARSILLTYVQNYGRKKGWGSFETHSVLNSLRGKIQDMRSKYGSTV